MTSAAQGMEGEPGGVAVPFELGLD
jgi:hypothetical protein